VITSTLILIGYAIPGFVLGITLLVLFGGGSFWDVFPLRGLTSDNWEELSLAWARSSIIFGTWCCRSSPRWSAVSRS
jgi:ABC-type microcin C transport system permease subunit YejB